MKIFRTLMLCFCTVSATGAMAEEFLDKVHDKLAISALENKIRMQLSGLLDLEAYHFPQPAPGLIYASGHNLFNPRLSLFADVQLGSRIYLFAQARLDRGFDPSEGNFQARADEYALRLTPWDDGRFNLQIGKFATVVGNFTQRHLSWENPFVSPPLLYENITTISDVDAPANVSELVNLVPSKKYDSTPLIWGPSYATGASVAGRIGRFDYAAEIKNGSLSSRPETWDALEIGFENPTVSTRLGFRPNPMWNFGVSASDGAYFRPEARPTLPAGHDIGDYHQTVIGQDVSFAWHHFQFWAECYEARFHVPRIGDADTVAYYLEIKYKFTPRFFGALRWNQQFFGTVPDGTGREISWGPSIWRTDAALGYRLTAHVQLKFQYSAEHKASSLGHIFAGQITVKF